MRHRPRHDLLAEEWLRSRPIWGALLRGAIWAVFIVIVWSIENHGAGRRPWLSILVALLLGVLFVGVPGIVRLRRGSTPDE